ncbi:hypothetical protein [Actinomadura sp. HBU206391]|uniref:hypothetical protein n=1 Tax=Actinomadura sp. HBU206391 TaxID=2731692 RepID=UPI0016503164|nr:hypothetical protein [Actinomadura sp. HBU206391]MBC6456355.1 hypothetical protein [Actinomadura sp. HBU206391]
MPSIRAADPEKGGYVLLSNVCARDRRLSGLARGIVYIILSWPPDWEFTIDWLMAEMTEGRRAISLALKELEEHGYLRRTKKSLGRGKWEWDQVLSDEPLAPAKTQVTTSGPSTSDESSSDEVTYDDNRADETTSGNTQVVSNDRFSSDDNRPDIRKTVLPKTVTKDESKQASAGGPPEFALPLINAIQARGLVGIRWALDGQWALVQSLIESKGLAAMTEYAVRAAATTENAGKPVHSAKYFLGGWRELPPKPLDGTAPAGLRLAGSAPRLTPQQQAEADMVQRQMQRARAREARS